MSVELTEMSYEEYNRIRTGQMTPAMASEYLKEGRIALRSFRECLMEMVPGRTAPEVAAVLQEALAEAEPEADRKSIARKVRNWLSGQNHPTNREDIFCIAFALGLSEVQTSHLLGIATEYGIHYRDGREAVYAWFLRHNCRYCQARDFFSTLPAVPSEQTFPENTREHLTRETQIEFLKAHTLEELRRRYEQNLPRLGTFHVRAYHYFDKYISQLVHPDTAPGSPQEPDYSLEAVMDSYLSLQMPFGRDRTNYSLVQKLLKRNWPNATTLKNIRSHRRDVPRKLLLLLYVITENITDGEYSELYEDYLTPEERLEDHWISLNAILTDCGMPTLDPRNAMDWLVLYAITASEESMSERMSQVIEGLFQDIQ